MLCFHFHSVLHADLQQSVEGSPRSTDGPWVAWAEVTEGVSSDAWRLGSRTSHPTQPNVGGVKVSFCCRGHKTPPGLPEQGGRWWVLGGRPS